MPKKPEEVKADLEIIWTTTKCAWSFQKQNVLTMQHGIRVLFSMVAYLQESQQKLRAENQALRVLNTELLSKWK